MSLAQKLDAMLQHACEGGAIPGVVATVADASGVVYEGSAGRRAIDKPEAMDLHTSALFASMTKAVTGAAAMQLVEQGKLDLDAPAGKVIPYLGQVQVLEGMGDDGKPKLRPARGTVTLRNLLTHTSGFAYEIWNPLAAQELESRGAGNVFSGTRETLERPLTFDPGTRWEYGIGIDWAGRMVEEVSGMRLGAYFRQNILDPLGMDSVSFELTPKHRENLAGMHARTPDGQIVPYPLEVGQGVPIEMGGHALYGKLTDYLKFTRAIAGGGVLDGTRILEAKTVEVMGQNHIGDIRVPDLPEAQPYSNAVPWGDDSLKYGLSFLVHPKGSPQGRSPGSLSWAGLANSYYWIDPVQNVSGAILTQILPFFDAKVVQLFAGIEAAVYQSRH